MVILGGLQPKPINTDWRILTKFNISIFLANTSDELINSETWTSLNLVRFSAPWKHKSVFYHDIIDQHLTASSASWRKHHLICHTNLSMNCWYESEELSNTSMLQGPSSCNLKSEFKDLNTEEEHSDHQLCSKMTPLNTAVRTLYKTSLNFSLNLLWSQVKNSLVLVSFWNLLWNHLTSHLKHVGQV